MLFSCLVLSSALLGHVQAEEADGVARRLSFGNAFSHAFGKQKKKVNNWFNDSWLGEQTKKAKEAQKKAEDQLKSLQEDIEDEFGAHLSNESDCDFKRHFCCDASRRADYVPSGHVVNGYLDFEHEYFYTHARDDLGCQEIWDYGMSYCYSYHCITPYDDDIATTCFPSGNMVGTWGGISLNEPGSDDYCCSWVMDCGNSLFWGPVFYGQSATCWCK